MIPELRPEVNSEVIIQVRHGLLRTSSAGSAPRSFNPKYSRKPGVVAYKTGLPGLFPAPLP